MVDRLLTMLLMVLISFSCSNQKDQSDLEERLEKLEKENKELRESIESSQENQFNSNVDADPVNTYSSPENSRSSYALIVLDITERKEKEGQPYGTLNPEKENVNSLYVSSVKTVNDLSSEAEYRMMDEFQNEYLNRFEARLAKGRVTNRQVKFYTSYEEASKAREALLLGKVSSF